MVRKQNRVKQAVCLLLALCILVYSGSAWAVEAGYTVFHGDRSKKEIAITVDDCYNADHVAQILDLCQEYQIPVTFFVIGDALKQKDQEIWLRALSLGCEIGNHTWSHARLPDLSERAIKRQLSKTQERLDEILGQHYPMQVMRPPYGRLSTDPDKKSDMRVVEAIEEAGYLHAVRWDVSQTDADKAIKDIANGSILLYHANRRDIRCLKKLIPAVLAMDYQCVTVSDLLDLPEPLSDPPESWLVQDE